MDSLWQEEMQAMLLQLTRQTESGELHWECTSYNPISLLGEDRMEDEPACVSQTFDAKASINGVPYTLALFENIDIPSGLGDISITVTREMPEHYLRVEDALSYHTEIYDFCQPDELLKNFANTPVTLLANAVVPRLATSEVVKDAFSWAGFIYENKISKRTLNHPITKLAHKLFCDQRVVDFHRIILDCDYRAQLLEELQK